MPDNCAIFGQSFYGTRRVNNHFEKDEVIRNSFVAGLRSNIDCAVSSLVVRREFKIKGIRPAARLSISGLGMTIGTGIREIVCCRAIGRHTQFDIWKIVLR